jgi:hypothetical protein
VERDCFLPPETATESAFATVAKGCVRFKPAFVSDPGAPGATNKSRAAAGTAGFDNKRRLERNKRGETRGEPIEAPFAHTAWPRTTISSLFSFLFSFPPKPRMT